MAVVKKTLPSKAAKKLTPRAVEHDDVRDFKLSNVVQEPSDNLQDYSILLFGEKKIGKTKLASLFPDSYFLKTEEGTKGVKHRGDSIHSWRLFRKALKLLAKDKSRTVIVDTVDLAYKLCFDATCAKLGIDDPSEEDWGKGWRAIRDEFTRAMQELMGMGKGVILISHASEQEIRRREGGKYHRIQPTMGGQARDICEAIVDIWGYFHYDGNRRVLTIRGDEHISAGHRLDTRFRWDGQEVVNIEMGTSGDEGLENFILCFNNRYEPKSTQVEEEKPPVRKAKIVRRIKR